MKCRRMACQAWLLQKPRCFDAITQSQGEDYFEDEQPDEEIDEEDNDDDNDLLYGAPSDTNNQCTTR